MQPIDLFISSAREQEVIQHLQEEMRTVVQGCYPDVDTLVREIEASGLPVITEGPPLQLKLSMILIGAEPGFIPPTLPRYPEFVESLKKYLPAEKACQDFSSGVLIALRDHGHYPFLAYHFYHWRAFKTGLEGYHPQARRLYGSFTKKSSGQAQLRFLEKLDGEESLLLRGAIRRDKEAFQFVRQMLNEVFIPMNSARLIETGRAQA